jgi:ABC-type antimicrobial peptide transport system permease subunit
MRAIGMSGRQLDRMITCEAGTYGATGCVVGIVLGLVLQKLLITGLLS